MVEMTDEINIDMNKIDDEVKKTKPKFIMEKQTQEQLITELAKEMRKLLKGVYAEADADGDDIDAEYVNFTVYEQLTPFHYKEAEEESPFPYCTVKYSSSRLDDVSKRENVDVLIELGIYYPEDDRQYHHIFFHIFNIVRKRFIADNFLGNFRCEPEMTFALTPSDEDTYPYYFAGIGMRWAIPGIDREVDFWNS